MLALLLACATPTVETAEASAESAPSGSVDPADCKTTCSLGDHVEDDHLDHGQIGALFEMWNEQPVGEPTIELETLLFYAPDVLEHLAERGSPELDTVHQAFLTRELARDRATMEMRLLAEDGTVRGTLVARDIPLKEKQHITFEGTGSLGHLETGGKVKRVGLDHLWSRW
ncbi:MAG: hypothetical protein GY913_07210 [Proteobacteria bacterium]|nr:hypothetical protein [Pseudomonadota bacterium]MCP4916697.1 hypothetical protein [Pseudomonadota bacterium]